jgi:hypothetical protein
MVPVVLYQGTTVIVFVCNIDNGSLVRYLQLRYLFFGIKFDDCLFEVSIYRPKIYGWPLMVKVTCFVIYLT